MKLKTLLIVWLGLLGTLANSSVLPPNNLHNFDDPSMVSNITEEEFEILMKRVQDEYAPIVSELGGELEIEGVWSNGKVNAFAKRLGDTWLVTMYGGLARRPELTQDGFILIVCHEVGHHVAGFPYAYKWSSNEGQSDFFASHVCAKKIWGEEYDINAKYRESVDTGAKKKCDMTYSTTVDQDLCYRIAMAGKSLSNLLAFILRLPSPSFDTPDTSVVDDTIDEHPAPQCRLDTYLGGALCLTEWNDEKIPGHKYKSKFQKKKAEKESLKYSCSQFNAEHVLSQRPKCWFDQSVKDR
jgi:hypothetical protein